MKNFFLLFLALFLFSLKAFAENFPNISGNVLFQMQADRVTSSQKSGVSPNNGFVYVEPNISFNINKNWSIKTDWRLQPNDVLTTRNSTYPERYRTFLQSNRGFSASDEGLLVEELKLNFENEDMRFFTGKFDPTFGTAYNKAKRIGVFTSQFTEDYNLREKIGAGITALLENSKITANSFFNDTTNLSSSALSNRGRASRNDGTAGNTGTLSSYSIAMNGENFLGIEGWFYNAGYRSLSVDKMDGRRREKGYVFGSEYAYQTGSDSSIIPFFEAVKIDNFTGIHGRKAIYTTSALIGKYSSWTVSVSNLTRNIEKAQTTPKSSDRQVQLSVGYKFTNNLTVDFTRSNLKETGNRAVLYGALVSYVHKF
jgi:hypothetical protein